jgi:hypothetical protein
VIRRATNLRAPRTEGWRCAGAPVSTESRPDATTVFGGEWAAVLLRRGVDSGELIQLALCEHHGQSAPCAGAEEGLAGST